ncbi:MAG: hypothetical protein OIN87_01140 [Candidatus Methanoperedens sp.]|nr:hypothetical protein [Candidatus Methanoperedens sp.]
MKFAEKCPKCGGFVQTKSVRKSIGLGFVEIPIAQFCLNPVCDWYQDFAQPRKPGEIKEGYHLETPSFEGKLPQFKMPALTRNHMLVLGSIFGILIIYFLISSLMPLSNPVKEITPIVPLSGITNNSTANTASSAKLQETPKVTTVIPSHEITNVNVPGSKTVKMDVGHGFSPDSTTINISDTIIWFNEENMRTRVVLVSREKLFENQLLQDYDRYQFQFNITGKYTFAIAEYSANGTFAEYPNATGIVIVK